MISLRVTSRILSCRFFSSTRASSNSSNSENNQANKDNVNWSDVQHHSHYSADWWDTKGPMKGLHALNELRVPFIREGLISTGAVDERTINKPNVLQGVKVLEVGCGAGILTEALGKLRANVTAIDPSEDLISAAKDHSKSLSDINVTYLCETIDQHSLNNLQKYDAVVASEVLEHVTDQKMFLKSCVDTLKPGGSIFITTFNKTRASWLAGIVAAEYILDLVPKNTHDWNLFISPEEVEKILKDFDCSTVLVHGIRYEFWRNTCVWQGCTGVNYALHAVKNT